MSLYFTTNGRHVEHGSDASIDDLDPYTLLMWVRTNAASGGGLLATKGAFPDNRHINLTRTGADVMRVVLDRATTDLDYITTTTIPDDAWTYVGCSFNSSNGANEIVNLYTGSLTVAATEVAYNSRTDGAGAFGSDAASNLRVGDGFDDDFAYPGAIAIIGLFNVELSAAQIVGWQWRPSRLAGCVLYCHYGFNGTGTQPDWSGNANPGTVTGATVDDHILGPFFGYDLPSQSLFPSRKRRRGFTNYQVPAIAP